MTRLFAYWEKGEPLLLWTRRLRLDALFALLFFVVMCDRFTGNPIHEALGTAVGLVALLHALLNRRWYVRRLEKLTGRARRRTSWQPRDVVSLIVNVFLTLSFAAAFVSGLMCSQTLFASATPDVWRMDLAYRSAHVALSLWCFLAAAVHVGLHGGIVAGKLAPAVAKLERTIGIWGVRAAGTVLFLLLLWRTSEAFVARDVGYALRAESAYLYVEPGELSILLPLDLLTAFLAVASLVHTLDGALARRPS